MKIFVNQKVRRLFIQQTSCILVSLVCSVSLLFLSRWQPKGFWWAKGGILACSVGAGLAVLFFYWRYFTEQNRMMEDAVTQVREYIAGDRDRRIECDDEGELYRLFHEVNSLAAILNAQAEHAGRTRAFLKQTISDISHQLKTPLAALEIYNGIIQTEAKEQDLATIQKFSGLSDQELDRIQTLVQNLLKIAKFDAGTIVMERHPENMAAMMEEVKRQFAFRAGREGKEILLSGSDRAVFSCDRSWIGEAVGNLVKNALDHMKRGDTVRIEWQGSASMVRLVVADNGSGIHPEDLHHIFKRFYRSRYSKDTQGIGLGLPLAKSVIEAHRGTIEVDSRPGQGTRFVMNFLVSGQSAIEA